MSSQLTYSEAAEIRLLAAMREYNRLYPNAPIKKLGHSPDRYFYLLGFHNWRAGDNPLSADAIAAIEWETDGATFS